MVAQAGFNSSIYVSEAKVEPISVTSQVVTYFESVLQLTKPYCHKAGRLISLKQLGWAGFTGIFLAKLVILRDKLSVVLQ